VILKGSGVVLGLINYTDKGVIILDSEMSNNLNEIRKIEDKYGLVLFRMGLTHLVDAGYNNLTDDEVIEETIKSIMAQGEINKAEGKIPVMTPEFQCQILRCAADLTKFSIWTLFAYIKRHVHTD
jgi:hypothetical protein